MSSLSYVFFIFFSIHFIHNLHASIRQKEYQFAEHIIWWDAMEMKWDACVFFCHSLRKSFFEWIAKCSFPFSLTFNSVPMRLAKVAVTINSYRKMVTISIAKNSIVCQRHAYVVMSSTPFAKCRGEQKSKQPQQQQPNPPKPNRKSRNVSHKIAQHQPTKHQQANRCIL